MQMNITVSIFESALLARNPTCESSHFSGLTRFWTPPNPPLRRNGPPSPAEQTDSLRIEEFDASRGIVAEEQNKRKQTK